jgi:hypothetical protein
MGSETQAVAAVRQHFSRQSSVVFSAESWKEFAGTVYKRLSLWFVERPVHTED